MFSIKEIYKPKSIEEAYKELVKRKTNVVLGGTLFLRMGNKNIHTAIDISSLNLSYIKEYEDYLEIGAMTTLREIEVNELILKYFKEVSQSVKDIIGVQFRNIATIGASVYSKYGFSDVVVSLLAYNTEVELYDGGKMSLDEFLQAQYKKDLLTKIYVYKNVNKAKYMSMRNESSDYPILNMCVSKHNNEFKVCIGARPQRAIIAKNTSTYLSQNEINNENINKAVEIMLKEVSVGSNIRASKEYRQNIAKVFLKRAIMEVEKC